MWYSSKIKMEIMQNNPTCKCRNLPDALYKNWAMQSNDKTELKSVNKGCRNEASFWKCALMHVQLNQFDN